MNLKRITLSLIMVVAIGGGYYYFDVVKAKQAQEAMLAKGKAIGLNIEKVDKLTIKIPGDETLTLIKSDGVWAITEPDKAKADNLAVETLINAASYMTVYRTVGAVDNLDLKTFGLDNPTTITFGQGVEESHTLRVGNKTPRGGHYYAIGKSKESVILVNQGRVSSVIKNMFDLRDKDIFPFGVGDVSSFSMQNSSSTIAGEHRSDGWWMTSPVEGKADGDEVGKLLKAITSTTVSGFLVEKMDNRGKYGLTTPLATFKLTDNNGDLITMELGAKTAGGGYYATYTGFSGVVRVVPDTMRLIAKGFDKLRERRLLALNSEDFIKLNVTKNGETVSLSRNKGSEVSWSIVEPIDDKTDEAALAGLLAGLTKMKATRIVSDNLHDMEKYGLKSEMAVIGVATDEETWEVTLGEALVDGAKGYYAANGRAIYEIPSVMFKLLFVGVESLGYRNVFSFRTEEVGRVVVERMGQIFEVIRNDESFKLIQPEKLDLKGDVYNRFIWTIISLKFDRKLKPHNGVKRLFNEPEMIISVYNKENMIIEKIVFGAMIDGEKRFIAKSELSGALYEIDERFLTSYIVSALEVLIK